MSEDQTAAARKKNFKKGIDKDEGRRRRSDQSIQIRKTKKEESLNQRRRTGMAEGEAAAPSVSLNPTATNARLPSPELIQELTNQIFGSDPALHLKATQQFRRLLSIEQQPPIQQVIEAGVVKVFVAFLQRHDNPALQFEAAWALTNIASGTSEHTRVVIDAGGVPIFVQLLLSPNEDVREQAAWALGNIAGDSVHCRDLVIASGGIPALLSLGSTFAEHSRLSTIRNTTWTLSNLCRGKPQPPFDVVKPCLPLLATLVYSHDMETVTDACWALSYLSDGKNECIQAVLNAGVAVRLVELLGNPSATVQTPALRTVGNIVTGDDSQTQVIINLNGLPALLWLLDHPKKNIRKEACWTISNVTAGTSEQIQGVITAGIIPKLIQLLNVAEFEIQKESAWALSNATSGGTPEQIFYIVSQGALPPLCKLLEVQDARIATVALEGIDNILKAGQQAVVSGGQESNPIVDLISDLGGLDAIEQLQDHDNHAIYQKAVRIIETYFGGEEDTETMIEPNVSAGAQQYSFGAPPGGGEGGPGGSQPTVFNFGGPPS